MTFLHFSLLAGIGLAVLPILLHLTAKKSPQKLIFPALRFVRETAVQAERGWRAKHWLLLSLRVLLLALIAFALAAPRVQSAMLANYVAIGILSLLSLLAIAATVVAYSTRKPRSVLVGTAGIALALSLLSVGWGIVTLQRGKAPILQASSGPIAAALVIDTSPTMDYRSNNQTRLEVAKEMGKWLIDRLPAQSQLAIVTTDQGLRLSPDRLTAERQLARVTLEGKSCSLRDRVLAAMELVRGSTLERREVYLLSDLMAKPWESSGGKDLAAELKKEPQVLLQIIDVGLEKMQNLSLVDLRLSQQVVTPKGGVDLEAIVSASSQTPTQQVTVELLVEPIDPTLPMQRNGKTIVPAPKPVDRQVVELEAGGQKRVRFPMRNLAEGTHQVQLRLMTPDPLQLDNVAYATVEAKEGGKVLVVCDDLDTSAQLVGLAQPALQGADDGSEGDPQGRPSRCERVDSFRLDTVDFASYACIVLFDPTGLGTNTVDKLEAFVEKGGSLLILLGRKLGDANRVQTTPVARLLPGKIERLAVNESRDRTFCLNPVLTSHPIFHPLDDLVEEAPWVQYPVFNYWAFSDLRTNASIIVRYTSSLHPAILDEARGSGRIVTWTTPIPEAVYEESGLPWNQLWNGTDEPWPTFGLLLGSLRYLSGWGNAQLNYTVGQTATLECTTGVDADKYELFAPGDEVMRISASNHLVQFPYTKRSGAYRLRNLGKGESNVRGFAVNIAKEDLALQRIDPKELRSLLGSEQINIAKAKEEIESSIGQARYGSELYPFLMLILVLLLLGEQAMSSRFYSIRI